MSDYEKEELTFIELAQIVENNANDKVQIKAELKKYKFNYEWPINNKKNNRFVLNSLQWSIELDNLPVFNFLLDEGVNVNSRTHNTNQTNLQIASKLGHVEMVNKLLRVKDIDINAQDGKSKNEWTALHYAVVHKNIEVVKALLANKANINIADDVSLNTPLHCAIENKDYEISKLLILNNANIKCQNREKFTPYGLALSLGDQGIIELFADEFNNEHVNEQVNALE